MTPIPTNLGWTTRKPHTAGAPTLTNPSSDTQFQSLLQRTHAPQTVDGPSRATVRHLHPGGMNDSVHRLLTLGVPAGKR
jgi:hypothetical protein